MKKIIAALAFVLLATNTASAQSKHVRDMQIIDAALPTAKISPAQKAEVIKLRRDGEKLHFANNHGAAEVALERAKAILRSK
jgi:hypothetical protein